MNFLEQLNDSQKEAVLYNDGASLVIAGAGSGKTRVLTFKIAYLLSNEIPSIGRQLQAWEIMALTFTNKAAREMQERVGRIVGEEQARRLQMGTFHSIFARILRTEASEIGYRSNFTIYDDSDSRSLVKAVIKQLGLDEKQYKPATVLNTISMAKNNLITSAKYRNSSDQLLRDKQRKLPEINRIYTAYQNRLLQSNAMDFDDLLLNTYTLLNEHSDIRQKYAERFKYVLVDEYQDTNYAQQQIVWLLTKDSQHVCVVGDDAQSIYAFRGANIDNILNFQSLYTDVKLFKLERNYRSTKNIVLAANSLIKKNQRQIPKDIYSKNEEGEKLLLRSLYSDKEEAAVVCKDILRLKREDSADFNDFAILYRTNAQSRSFEEQLRKMDIPYRIYGGLSFYQRKEIKDIIAYFRLVINHSDEEAFKRIINYPARGIGATTIQKIIDGASNSAKSLWDVASQASVCLPSLSRSTAAKVISFCQMISSFEQSVDKINAYELGLMILKDSGLQAELNKDISPEGKARLENMQELVNALADFVDAKMEEGDAAHIYLEDYLQEVTLLTDLESDGEAEEGKVRLMTIHSAKGLEFPTVFVVGLEEDLFPSPMAKESLRELEEERRLFYVAITRAERHCILTTSKSRYRYGRMEFGRPSRFLQDIDSKYISGDIEEKRQEPSFRHHYEGNNLYGQTQRMQNANPVASQFMADPKRKITAPPQKEVAYNPFSDRFRDTLQKAGGNLKRVDALLTKGNRTLNTDANNVQKASNLHIGATIEHDRFGKGRVENIEGQGENAKITVEFQNVGKKQLLVKFARFRVL